jgi:FKBP-type peptidyl-prolyl cis-trans isomerase
MEKILFLFILFFSDLLSIESNHKIDIKDQASKAMGKILQKKINESEIPFSLKHLIEGLQDKSFAQSEINECEQILNRYKKEIFQEKSEKNLSKAETFLNKNKKNTQVIEITKNKLQYLIKREGTGKIIKNYHSPLVRITGNYLDGPCFLTDDEPQKLDLLTILPSLKQGLVGMREKEIRIIYIHPDLGFKKENALNSNSLLTFEIEVLDVNPCLDQPINKSLELSQQKAYYR